VVFNAFVAIALRVMICRLKNCIPAEWFIVSKLVCFERLAYVTRSVTATLVTVTLVTAQ
jgi:hypothetical protein